jgi:hypothetical protein
MKTALALAAIAISVTLPRIGLADAASDFHALLAAEWQYTMEQSPTGFLARRPPLE